MTISEFIRDSYIHKNNQLYTSQGSRTPMTNIAILTAYAVHNPNASVSPTGVKEAMDEYIKEIIANEVTDSAPRFRNEIEFVQSVLRQHQIDSNRRGDKFTQVLTNGGKRDIEYANIEAYLRYEIGPYNRSVGRELRYQIGSVLAGLDVLLHTSNNNVFSRLQDDLKYDKNADTMVNRIIDRIIDVMEIEVDVDVAHVIFRHFFWLIKRNLFSLPTINELWIAFFGAQGCGKNYMAKHIFAAPISEFYVETELDKLGDIDREIRKFTDNLIVNFDELAMGSGDKTSKVNDSLLQNLKTIVTRTEMTFRQMGGQKQIKMDKKFVPISTANHHLYDVIYDNTGMRRFFEFTSKREVGLQFDNAEVAEIRKLMTTLYRGIDETNERGYLDFTDEIGKKVQAIQNSYEPRTSIHEWIDDNSIVTDTQFIPAKSLYEDYSDYSKKMGYSRFGYKRFIEVLTTVFEVRKKDNVQCVYAKKGNIPMPVFGSTEPYVGPVSSLQGLI